MNVNGLLTKRWLSHLESNQNSGYQKPVCSRYTMGQAELWILYHISFAHRPVRMHLMRCGLLMLICITSCGLLRRNGARTPARASASLRGIPAAAPTVTAHGILGRWANGACVRLSLRGKARLLPRAASTVRCAILRRRDTTSSSRARPLAHHANCRRAVPLRSLLTHAPLARPSSMARFSS